MNGWKRQSATLFLKDPGLDLRGDCHVGNLGPVASAEGELAMCTI
jgi:uncharacterized protein (DUF2252 family)